MSHTGPAGAQQYSDEELRGHRRRGPPGRAQGGGARPRRRRHPGRHRGGHRLHRARLADERRDARPDDRAGHLPRADHLPRRRHGHRRTPRPSCRPRPPRCSPGPRRRSARPSSAGARIACGTDAPAIPHGRNAKELIALVDRGMTPLQAIRAATTVAAELIDVDDRGRLEPGLLADVIAVPGDPLADITATEKVRVRDEGRPGVPPRRRRVTGRSARAAVADASAGRSASGVVGADAVEEEVPQLARPRRGRRGRWACR